MLVSSGVGCNVGGMFVNVLAYADDMVLLAPSWKALPHLLSLLDNHISSIDLTCNTSKTVCMMFCPRQSSKVVSLCFPSFKLGCHTLQFVKYFKYLGHMISETLSDDDDIKREVQNLFLEPMFCCGVLLNVLPMLKLYFFKTYCICFYDIALWSHYTVRSLNKLMSSYNKCVKLLFGYKRRDSVTEMLFTLGLPSFATILHNSSVIFARCWSNCCNYNELVKHFHMMLR